MNLDFSKCETKEDVERVFKKSKEEIETIKNFKKRLGEVK